MLYNIRKATDNWIMKALLGFIALAFIWWGIKDVLQPTNDFDLVTFSDTPNITESEFLKAKTQEIKAIQRQMATSLSEDQMAQIGIDNLVMRKLITDRIMHYLITYYNLDLSDEMVINLVKKSPVFHNEHEVFDIEIFRAYFKNSHANEAEYLLNFKEKHLKQLVINTFVDGFVPSKMIVKNIVDDFSESRHVEIIERDLQYVPKNFQPPEATSKELEDFYHANQQLFEIPEKRKFYYIQVSSQALLQKINIAEQELLEFYNDNKDEFGDQSFEQSKTQLSNLLQSQKLDEVNMELARALEDDVAAGASLIEIAEKYKLPLRTVDYVSYDELVADKIITDNASNIFELTEGELSYPIELSDKSGFILVELKSIRRATIPAFEQIKTEVRKLWIKQHVVDLNLQEVKDIAQKYASDHKNHDFINNSGFTIREYDITKLDVGDNPQIPGVLLLPIFYTKVGNNSAVVQTDGKVYFVHVKSVSPDDNKARTVQQNLGEKIVANIKNSVVDELISYCAQKDKIQINKAKGN